MDVGNDKEGEFFEIRAGDGVELSVLDVQPKDRHLLLLARVDGEKQKFLCGHDERHWFVAAIPEKAPVGTVKQAKEALKPEPVREALNRSGVSEKKGRNLRKNEVFKRQGEWFFIPRPGLKVDTKLVIRNEPITRGDRRGSKPHMAEYCYRAGGTTVYVSREYPNGISADTYNKLIKDDPSKKNLGWRMMVRDAKVYVRGTIRHSDHKTIYLDCWHEVLMNTENQAKAMRHVAFLD